MMKLRREIKGKKCLMQVRENLQIIILLKRRELSYLQK